MWRVETFGLREAVNDMRAMAVGLNTAARTIVEKSAALVERNAKQNFQGSHRRGMPHVGGDKPNVVSGTLRRSITHDPVTSIGLGAWGTRVGPTTAYGRRIELGYPGGGGGRGHHKTRAFPYFGPAAARSEAELELIAVTEWGRLLK